MKNMNITKDSEIQKEDKFETKIVNKVTKNKFEWEDLSSFHKIFASHC